MTQGQTLVRYQWATCELIKSNWQMTAISPLTGKPLSKEVHDALPGVTRPGPLVSLCNTCSNSIRHPLEATSYFWTKFWDENVSVVWYNIVFCFVMTPQGTNPGYSGQALEFSGVCCYEVFLGSFGTWLLIKLCAHIFFLFKKSSPKDMFILERQKERERNIDWLPPIYARTGDWTSNLDMCPDQ